MTISLLTLYSLERKYNVYDVKKLLSRIFLDFYDYLPITDGIIVFFSEEQKKLWKEGIIKPVIHK